METVVCCDLEVDVNGEEIFWVNKKILASFSSKISNLFSKMSTYTRKRTYRVKFQDFPGGPHGFSLMARFCSNKGNIDITPSNIVVFNHEARSLEMIKPYLGSPNLMTQTEEFLLGFDSWSWPDLLIALENGQHFQSYDCHTIHHVQYLKNNTTLVDKDLKKFITIKKSSSLLKTKLEKTVRGEIYYAYSLQRLVDEIIARLSLSMMNPSASSSKSTSFRSSCDLRSTTHNTQTEFSPHYSWWFEDLSTFNVELVEIIIKAMLVEKFDHTLISKFLVYYLKNRAFNATRAETIKIIEKVIDLLFMLDKSSISLKKLFYALRVASKSMVSKCHLDRLEIMIGSMLDQATLDDLLVPPPHGKKCMYNLDLIRRLTKTFFLENDHEASVLRWRKVAWLMDLYAVEIAADVFVEPSEFAAVVMALPDHARETYDKAYQSIDIYFQVHKRLYEEQKLGVCYALNYAKFSPNTLKELARNPNFPLLARYKARSYLSSTVKCRGVKFVGRRQKWWFGRAADLHQIGGKNLDLENFLGGMRSQMIAKAVSPRECCVETAKYYLPKLCS